MSLNLCFTNGRLRSELIYNNHLRCDAAQPLPGAAAAVELGHDHGVADRHQQDRDEEHDDVHEEVVDLLGDLDVDHVVGLQVALQPGGEDLVAGPLVPDHTPGLVLNRVRIELSNRTFTEPIKTMLTGHSNKKQRSN